MVIWISRFLLYRKNNSFNSNERGLKLFTKICFVRRLKLYNNLPDVIKDSQAYKKIKVLPLRFFGDSIREKNSTE